MDEKNKETSAEAKQLRWLAAQFPYYKKPKDSGEKMSNAINLYCCVGANRIEFLEHRMKHLFNEEFEAICEKIHDAWWEEKKKQGVTDHPDMIPYSELSEEVKEYDRVTLRTVLEAINEVL